jgi:hypothetical protein
MSGGNESTTYLRGFKAAELKEEDIPLIREQTKPKSSEPHIHQQIY